MSAQPASSKNCRTSAYRSFADRAPRRLADLVSTTLRFSLHRIFWIQSLQFFDNKSPILPDQPAIKINLAPAVFRSLDADQIPVDLTTIPVIGRLIGLTRGEVKWSRNS